MTQLATFFPPPRPMRFVSLALLSAFALTTTTTTVLGADDVAADHHLDVFPSVDVARVAGAAAAATASASAKSTAKTTEKKEEEEKKEEKKKETPKVCVFSPDVHLDFLLPPPCVSRLFY